MSVTKNIILGILLTSISIIVFSGFIGDLAKNTGIISDNNTMNSTYNKIFEINNLTESMSNEISNAKLESSNIYTVVTEAPIKTVKLLFNSIGFITSLASEFTSNIVGCPEWVGTLINIFITITLIVLLVGLFMRWRT